MVRTMNGVSFLKNFFQPSDRLQEYINEFKRSVNGQYIAIHFRFRTYWEMILRMLISIWRMERTKSNH